MQPCCSDSKDMTKIPAFLFFGLGKLDTVMPFCCPLLCVITAPFDSYLHFFNSVQYWIVILSVSTFYAGKVKCTG